MPAQEEHSLPAGFGTRPWLVQARPGTTTLTLVDALDRSLHEATIPELEGKTCLGCVRNGEWLVMLDASTGECFLILSPTAGGGPRRRRPMIPLPPLREPLEHLATCVVLGSPGQPDCTVMVASSVEAGERFLLHGRPGDEEWTRLASPVPGVTFGSLMINFKEEVYAFVSSNNLVAIGLVGGEVRARRVGTIRDDEEERRGSSYYNHLVESCGQIFLVCVQQIGCFDEDGVPIDIIVYRLDLSDSKSMAWRRVESIGGDRAFLISGDYGFSCAAVNGQMEGNCVYLVWSCCDCERLYKFCLDDMTISYHQILPQPTHPWCRAFWSVPIGIQAMEEKEQDFSSRSLPKKVDQPNDMDNHIDEEVQANCSPPWHDLPLELLQLVVSNLSLVDRLRFPAVCKSWSMVTNPIEQAKVWPWLMHCSKQDGTCKMLDPLRGKEYTLRVETFKTDDERHIFRSSKDGWVIVSSGSKDDEIFIINPFTGDIVQVPPKLKGRYSYNGVSFSSVPTSSDCVFFGITSTLTGEFVAVYTWRHGEDAWSRRGFDYGVSMFPVARNNPVLFHGKFYCLGRKGNLGVFDPGSKTLKRAWKILDKPAPVHEEMELLEGDHEGREFCYLVELEGEPLSVFMRNAAEPPRVFKLDKKKMAWTEVEEIGGAALFLDSRASYAVASPEGGHGNRIYFPRFSEDGKQMAFYDMETKMYHPSFYGLKQPMNYVWVVPNLIRCR